MNRGGKNRKPKTYNALFVTILFISVLLIIFFVFMYFVIYINTNLASCCLLILAITLGIGFIKLNEIKYNQQNKPALSKIKSDNEIFQNDRIYAIVNNLTDGVISTDSNGVIQVYNASALNLLDTNDDLNNRHIDEMLPLVDQKNFEVSVFKELKSLKTVTKRDDFYLVFENGDKIRLELTYAPIKNIYDNSTKIKDISGYIIIFRDVTKIKSLEEERDEFISVISHELRTPITIAEGSISNVQVIMSHPNATKKMLKDAVSVAHEQILFLAHMVNDLSTLSRAERGVSDTKEDIDVRELAHSLHDKYKDEAKAKKLHIDIDLSPKLGVIYTSRLYVEELLQNFITNAIKYTKKGNITINFTQKNGIITFAIKDTGIGLNKTDKTRIFEKFYRSEDYRTRETTGTGLGLYVATKLANKLGTKIELQSRLNFGSTFSFDLPVKENINE